VDILKEKKIQKVTHMQIQNTMARFSLQVENKMVDQTENHGPYTKQNRPNVQLL